MTEQGFARRSLGEGGGNCKKFSHSFCSYLSASRFGLKYNISIFQEKANTLYLILYKFGSRLNKLEV